MPGTAQDSAMEALHDTYDKLLQAWSENHRLRTLLGLRANDAIPDVAIASPPKPISQPM